MLSFFHVFSVSDDVTCVLDKKKKCSPCSPATTEDLHVKYQTCADGVPGKMKDVYFCPRAWRGGAVPSFHDDVIKWKHFPCYWSFVRGIRRSPVNSPHKGQWRGTLMFSLIYAWTNSWANNRDAGDLRRHRAHYDVTVMTSLVRQ